MDIGTERETVEIIPERERESLPLPEPSLPDPVTTPAPEKVGV